MTDWSAAFMPRDGQLFPRTVGELLAIILRRQFPRDTAKVLERRYEFEAPTAKNVAKGHASERSITRILYGEGEDVFALLDALGHALTGITRDEWEERRLNKIIMEAERAQDSHRLVRLRRALLAESIEGLEQDLQGPAEGRSGSGQDRESRRHA
jgi:hypothetical protein